jgi:hypothetical protein
MRPCNVCGESSCVCQKSAGPSAMWLTKHCATEGCNTTIRWPSHRPMGEPTCKWCQEKANEVGA